jgi:pimeloyl-ACP methyl ester carboxylesterase
MRRLHPSDPDQEIVMQRLTAFARAVTLTVLVLSLGTILGAQSNPAYIRFTPSATKGALYKPDRGPAPAVAVLLIHRTGNFLSHLATAEFARRGFLVLAMNPRSDNNEAAVSFEDNALDIRSGIEFLRGQPGIKKVVLFGHSGGGPATSFYQAVAEKGVAYCQGANKLVSCGSALANLPRADAIVFADAHPGVSVNGLRSLNPAVIDEGHPNRLDPSLDPFDPRNGYSLTGASTYTEAFKARYFKAQADRMNRLIVEAQARLRVLDGDDDVMVVRRGAGARLMEFDPAIHRATAKPARLLKNDGRIVTQVVESVRPAGRSTSQQNASFTSARVLTLRSFLSANAVRATDSMDGIDWCSSNNSMPCAVQHIGVPVLFTAMGGHYFIRDNEIHYDMAASADKEFIVIEGATHNMTPCTACEKTPGEYSNVTKNFFNHVASWIGKRF